MQRGLQFLPSADLKSSCGCLCNRHAVVYVIEKAFPSTCLNTNWSKVLLLPKSKYLNQDTKGQKKSLFEVKRKLLKYSICFYDERNFKIKKTGTINSRPLKIENLAANSQLWYRKYTYLNCSIAAQEIKMEKQLKVSAQLCKVGVETIV